MIVYVIEVYDEDFDLWYVDFVTLDEEKASMYNLLSGYRATAHEVRQ